METLLFYPLALFVVISSIGVVSSRSAVYSVLWLVAAMCGTSAIFITLKAFLIAAIQVLVYAGAILVLFLFVVMLMDMRPDPKAAPVSRAMRAGAAAVSALFLWQVLKAVWSAPLPQGPAAQGTVQAVGRVLFNQYLLPFELTSFLILAAIVSIVVLAKKAA